MSDLLAQVLPLNYGLDLTTPKMLVQPGTLLDCLNYEAVDEGGLARISGYDRYDGRVSPSVNRYYAIRTDSSVASYVAGDVIGTSSWLRYLGGSGSSKAASPQYLGVLVDKYTVPGPSTNVLVFAPFEYSTSLASADINFASRLDLTTETLVNTIAVDYIQDLEELQLPDVYLDKILEYQAILRTFVTALPTVALGLHWFDDTLYAVAGAVVIEFESLGVGTYSYPIQGAVVTGSGGSTGTVLASSITSGASPNVRLTILDNYTGSWVGETVPGVVYDPMGSANVLAVESVTGDSNIAHLWEARTQLRILQEDSAPIRFGWEPIFQGWEFNYDSGDVPAGYFNKVERNQDSATPSTYYFSDGSTTLSAQILTYTVTAGSLATADAAGLIQIGALTPIAGTGRTLTAAYTIYADIALTIVVGQVTSTMVFAALEGLANLENANSRYEFISANFYATEALKAMYGVSGAGRAFYYDKTNFYKINTLAAVDTPRHLANHLGHLALGYSAGSVLLSVVGQPWNFSGVDGAAELAVGDRLTGLAVLQGVTLGVFCAQSVWSIAGSVVDSFQTQILVPDEGCIEYSLVIMGQPIFTSNWGVTTLEQSDKYGDFVGNRLSKKINKWLLPRIVDRKSGQPLSMGVLCAFPVRAKNQYRLVLRDGTVVTMTMTQEGPPAFTTQVYNWYDDVDASYSVKPLAVSSEIDDLGRERIHFSTWDADDGAGEYVYELDSGWGFDGKYIPHNFTINWYYGETITQFQTLAGVRIYGQSHGYTNMQVQASGIQNDMYFGGTAFSTTTTPLNLPRAFTQYTAEPQDTTNRTDLAARGLAIQLKFSGSNTDLTAIEPSHVAQVLITYSTPDGAFDL